MTKIICLLATLSFAFVSGGIPPAKPLPGKLPPTQYEQLQQLQRDMLRVKSQVLKLEKELSAFKKEYHGHWHRTEHEIPPHSYHVKYNWDSIPNDAMIPFLPQESVGSGFVKRSGKSSTPQ